jgi:short subunit dehydrogenase-like uncharacterized protein
MTGDFLLYGPNRYVGSALAGLAVDRGLRPIIAGRNAAAVEELATTLGLDSRIVAVDAAASQAGSDQPDPEPVLPHALGAEFGGLGIVVTPRLMVFPVSEWC